MMKFTKILRYLMAAVISAIVFCACEKEKDYRNDLPGAWELVSVSGQYGQTPQVYLDIVGDGKFVIFQRLDENSSYVRYDGSWTLTGNRLSGNYTDGTPWAAAYTVEVTDGMLTLTSGSEESIYKRISSIPDSIQISNF